MRDVGWPDCRASSLHVIRHDLPRVPELTATAVIGKSATEARLVMGNSGKK